MNLVHVSGVLLIASSMDDYKDMDDYKLPVKTVIKEVEVEKIVEVEKEVEVIKEVEILTKDFEIGCVYRVRAWYGKDNNFSGGYYDILCFTENGCGKVLYRGDETLNEKIIIGEYYLADSIHKRAYKIADNIHDYNYRAENLTWFGKIIKNIIRYA